MRKKEILSENEAILKNSIDNAWNLIAPAFPLKNIIAVNPLKGFEDRSFENAITESDYFFNDHNFPEDISEINCETIKWCQAYFDSEQSTIQMPLREMGFYYAVKKLLIFDKKIDKNKKKFILELSNNSLSAIKTCIDELALPREKLELIFKILLTTLPGWASYVKYKAKWDPFGSIKYNFLEYDYIAIRLVLSIVFCKNLNETLERKQKYKNKNIFLQEIENNEKNFHEKLIKKLHTEYKKETVKKKKPKAQFVFCIDVRSEPLRAAIEAEDDYETFGFAGFFGLPICIESADGQKRNLCPVLLKPTHKIEENFNDSKKIFSKAQKITLIKKIYQSLKYSFTTPFLLAELLGLWSGLWMAIKTFAPQKAFAFKRKLHPHSNKSFYLDEKNILKGISFSDQVNYAKNMLISIDLVDNFAPIIVLCGHGSTTQNNAYSSSLDCGACGGHDGGINARIMSTILNTQSVRDAVKNAGIGIPADTIFIAAHHNTTTDEVTLFSTSSYPELEESLKKAKARNNQTRSKNLTYKKNIKLLSEDWAQTRPEWGLAKNAAFIAGPREYTKEINLEGRCFLHSYNWEKDKNLEILTLILTAPMIVAQWINAQYLFSTLDPVTYGSGSKITQNMTGKIGMMQGNASDLMHGLPLQSTHLSDYQKFHEPMRLMTIIYAPKEFILNIIHQNDLLKKLAKNAWIKFSCMDPIDRKFYQLKTDLNWEIYEHI